GVHPPCRLLRGVERPVEVDGEDAPPLVGRDLEKRVTRADPGVRDEDVDAAEELVNGLEGFRDLDRIGHVRFERGGEAVDRVFARERNRDDARPLLEEAPARRRADPARAARDDDALAGEPSHPRQHRITAAATPSASAGASWIPLPPRPARLKNPRSSCDSPTTGFPPRAIG